jgi:hypothetical protein
METGAIRAVAVDWTRLYVELLRAQLQWHRDVADLRISFDPGLSVYIESWSDLRSGPRVHGRLKITVTVDGPRLVFGDDPWTSGACWSLRRPPQIEIAPPVLVAGAVSINTERIQRFTSFPAWEHAVYGRAFPTPFIGVFHSTSNASYPAVRVVVNAIEAHYALAPAGQ